MARMSTDEAKCLSPPPKPFGISSPSSALMQMDSPPSKNPDVGHLHFCPGRGGGRGRGAAVVVGEGEGGRHSAAERRTSVFLMEVKRHCVSLHHLIGLRLLLQVVRGNPPAPAP